MARKKKREWGDREEIGKTKKRILSYIAKNQPCGTIDIRLFLKKEYNISNYKGVKKHLDDLDEEHLIIEHTPETNGLSSTWEINPQNWKESSEKIGLNCLEERIFLFLLHHPSNLDELTGAFGDFMFLRSRGIVSEIVSSGIERNEILLSETGRYSINPLCIYSHISEVEKIYQEHFHLAIDDILSTFVSIIPVASPSRDRVVNKINSLEIVDINSILKYLRDVAHELNLFYRYSLMLHNCKENLENPTIDLKLLGSEERFKELGERGLRIYEKLKKGQRETKNKFEKETIATWSKYKEKAQNELEGFIESCEKNGYLDLRHIQDRWHKLTNLDYLSRVLDITIFGSKLVEGNFLPQHLRKDLYVRLTQPTKTDTEHAIDLELQSWCQSVKNSSDI